MRNPPGAGASCSTAPASSAPRSRGRGLFKDAASDALMRQTFFDGAVKNFQIVIPDFGTVAGPFQITSLEFAGEHDGEVTTELALESAGELTFTRELNAIRSFSNDLRSFCLG